MTAQLLFNQFAYTDRLSRGGFTPEQARASAEALEAALSDVVATRADLDRVETALKADITELKGDLELKIAQAKNDTLRWIFTFNLALVGAIFAIIKFGH